MWSVHTFFWSMLQFRCECAYVWRNTKADLRLSGKGMRCIDGIFRAISGPAPGVIWDWENCCLGSIKPFITGIREDIPVQKHTNATEQRCIQQRLWSTRLITVNVIQFDSPENAKPQFVKTNKNVFTVMHLRDASKCHRLLQNPEHSGKVKCVISEECEHF